MAPTVKIKRVYDEASKSDGYRVLVDRLWPRGIKKEAADVKEWAKELAPSDELRKWFGHDPALWPEFQKKYKAELKKNTVMNDFIDRNKEKKLITLVYSAKDTEHNQAVVIQQYLNQHYGS